MRILLTKDESNERNKQFPTRSLYFGYITTTLNGNPSLISLSEPDLYNIFHDGFLSKSP